MNTRGPWAAFIESITYKEGWSFEYSYEPDFDKEFIHVDMLVPDSRGSDKKVRVAQKFPLDPFHNYSKSMRQKTILYIIDKLEQHETREWLRFNGELVFDPHKE